MIFANLNAGHYLILNDCKTEVFAEITRQREYGKAKWPIDWYIIKWKTGKPTEKFRRLYEIQEKYQFSNYSGHGAILDPNRNYVG